ncbi:unnamed protein product [Effrenium voratum]|nr:unnamed protein product [Effrenium voratum]
MGGAGSTASAVAAGVGKMNEGDLKEIVKALDKKTLAALHKVVTEVSAGAEAEKQAATKAKRDADPELAAKIQKAIEEAGDNMRRAPFTWTTEDVPKVLEEAGLRGKCPEGLNGKQLVLEDVFPGKEDQETWDFMLGHVSYRWLEDQHHSRKPFAPPSAVCDHYVFKWDVAKTNAFLKKIGLPEYGSWVVLKPHKDQVRGFVNSPP